MRRPFYVFDANFKEVGTVWLDLDDPVRNCRVIFESDLTRALGPQTQIIRGRTTEGLRRGSIDDGVWSTGEGPPRPQRFPRVTVPGDFHDPTRRATDGR